MTAYERLLITLENDGIDIHAKMEKQTFDEQLEWAKNVIVPLSVDENSLQGIISLALIIPYVRTQYSKN